MQLKNSFIVAITTLLIFTCSKQKLDSVLPETPLLSMKSGETKRFSVNGLEVMYTKITNDLTEVMLYLLKKDPLSSPDYLNLDELILNISLYSYDGSVPVKLGSSQRYTLLSSIFSDLELRFAVSGLIEILYNQDFDSSMIKMAAKELYPESAKSPGDKDLREPGDEMLQRYHSDNFVTSRMAMVIKGNYSYEIVYTIVDSLFSDKTIGTFVGKAFLDDVSSLFRTMKLDSSAMNLMPDSIQQ